MSRALFSDRENRALILGAAVALAGPALVMFSKALLLYYGFEISPLYFSIFKRFSIMLPVMASLICATVGALPPLIILTESYALQRQVVALLGLLWAVSCLILSLTHWDFV